MPFYEYRCEACGETMTYLQPMSDRPRVRCGLCGRYQLKRKIGPVAVRVPTPTSEARKGRGRGRE